MKWMTFLTLTIAISFECVNTMALPKLNFFKPDNKKLHYVGRIDFSDPLKPKLSGAGAYFVFKFQGSSCEILLEDEHLNDHSYIAIEIDGIYDKRIKVSKNQEKYLIAHDLENSEHTVLICKATEAQNGYIGFLGIICDKLLPLNLEKKRKIEFIGNSITCGMGLDLSEISCQDGEWYDQHNAYLAYGPVITRQLRAEWLLSSVSGIGMTRTWNSPGPSIPLVYPNLNLNTDTALQWNDQQYIPDLITICLGTNDFSDGDGSYDRADLNSTTFVNEYIRFVKFMRTRYPNAPICLLSSPAIAADKGVLLVKYLSTIRKYMTEVEKDKSIYQFTFSRNFNNGCSGHPDKHDHEMMAKELLPFLKKVMNWDQ